MAVKKRFIHNALIMTAVTFLLRSLGTAFGIYASNKIGAEGMGLYQLASSVYAFAITLAISGITVAVTRLISERMAFKDHDGADAALRRCLFIGGGFGLLSGLLLFTLAERLGGGLLNDVRVIPSLKILAVGLPFLSVAAVLRGYFLGAAMPIKAVGGDFSEQISMIAISLPLIALTADKGIEYSCCALVIGSTGSEIISCVYTLILYLRHKSEKQRKKVKGVYRQIFAITAPIAISNYIRSALTMIENILIPKGIMKYGKSSGEALSQYGMLKGMAMPVIFFPSFVLSAFSSLLIPEISYYHALDNKTKINYFIEKCIKVTLLFGFFVCGIFIAFSDELGELLYKNAEIGGVFRLLAPLIPLLYLDHIVDSIIKGLNQQLSAMKYNTVDAIMRTILVWQLIPVMGMAGYIVMFYAGTIFNAALSLNRLIKVSRVKIKAREWAVIPIVCIIIACVLVKYLFHPSFIVALLLSAVIYFLLLFFTGCVRKRDILWVLRVFRRSKANR